MRAMPMPRVTAENLQAALDADVEQDARLMSDEFPAYKYVGREAKHETVNHKNKEYVRGDVHSNTAEGFSRS